MPVHNTTQSVSISPCSVATPVTLPPAVRIAVTGTFWKMRAPEAVAPFASALVTSTALA